MAIKLKHDETFSTYFITFTCEWMPLFEITDAFDMIINWFAVVKEKNNADVGTYGIMPNHVHVIVHFLQGRLQSQHHCCQWEKIYGL